jgi:hypothetical protein
MPFIIPALAALSAAELVIGAVILIGAVLVLSRKISAPPAPQAPANTYVANPLEMTIGTEVPRRMVYGFARISGVCVYANVSGDGHEYLWLVVIVAAHPIEGIQEIYFDNEVGSTKAGFYDAWYYDGTQTTSDPNLNAAFPEWGTDCILNGCAYAVVRLKYDKDVWKNGRPNVTFDVKGKKVYDHRTGVTVWSDNAALCTADYMTSQDGLKALTTEIDWATVDAAADICGQLPVQMAASLCDGRYTINGVIEMTSRAGEIIDDMVSCMAGTLVYTEGVYRMFAGAIRAPVARAITADDLRDAPTLQPRTPSDQSFNCVKGTFLDQTNGWTFTDFPPVIGDPYIAEDGGVKTFKDLVLKFTTSPIMAQRLATIFLRRARWEKTITLPCKWTCFNYEVWDVVPVNLPQLGWVNKPFQITDWKMITPTEKGYGGIDLQLIEYDDDIFNDDITVKPISGGGTINVPDVGQPAPIGTLFATSDATSVSTDGLPRVRFDWASSPDIYAIGYEIAFGKVPYIPTADADYQFVSGRLTGSFFTPPLTPGDTYVGYIRVVNTFDRRSAATESNAVVVQGAASQYPEDLHGLTVTSANADYADLTWAGATGSNVEQTEIRWSPDGLLGHSVVVTRIPYPQNTVRVLKNTTAGTYFAGFVSNTGLYGNFGSAAGLARVPATFKQSLSLNTGECDLINGLFVNGDTEVVPLSQSLAADLGFEVFDLMVPNPFPTVTVRKKTSVFTDVGDYRVSGTLGWRRAPMVPGTLPVMSASAQVAHFASTEILSGTFTLTENANTKLQYVATSSDPQGFVINAVNGLLEQL